MTSEVDAVCTAAAELSRLRYVSVYGGGAGGEGGVDGSGDTGGGGEGKAGGDVSGGSGCGGGDSGGGCGYPYIGEQGTR